MWVFEDVWFGLVWGTFFYIMTHVLYKTMIKIKDIHERVHKNPQEYNELRFLIARRIFIIIVAAYFTSLLFTIWGFYGWTIISIQTLSLITFHLYSLLIIVTVWFAFSVGEYFAAIYMPGKGWFAYIILAFFAVFWGAGLYVHLSSII